MSKVLGIQEIKAALPYRYPMIMIDRFTQVSETEAIGYKALSFNEEFFQGHFPNHPIMPGVLQVEAMKQTAELAVVAQLNPNGTEDVYLKSMKNVKFRKPNNPGDRIRVEVTIDSIENNEASVTAKIKNNAGVSCQAKLVLAVRPYEAVEQTVPEHTEFDKSEEIALDINGIMDTIPHRYPFLFLDYVKEMSDEHIIAIKNTTFNEPVFRGYTPENAVLPETIQAEMLAQAGCAAILAKPENKGKIGYFMSIGEAHYLHPIHPGDQLICKMKISGGSGRFGKGDGAILVGDKTVATCKLTFALVDA